MSLDLLCLRTFVAIVDGGSFAAGAARAHRSLSTASQQMERLGGAVGHALFVRQGRRMVLSEAGHRLLPHARGLLTLEDRALAALRAPDLTGPVRLGAVQDFAEDVLPETLRRFRARHPMVRLSVRIGGSADLAETVARGEIDLALRQAATDTRPVPPLVTVGMIWIGGPDGAVAPTPHAPLPLVLFEGACPFREAALHALEDAGVAWRLAYESPSLSGLRAAVLAGLGVTVRTPRFLVPGLCRLDGLPGLPDVAHGIDRAAREGAAPAVDALADALAEALGAAPEPVTPPAGVW